MKKTLLTIALAAVIAVPTVSLAKVQSVTTNLTNVSTIKGDAYLHAWFVNGGGFFSGSATAEGVPFGGTKGPSWNAGKAGSASDNWTKIGISDGFYTPPKTCIILKWAQSVPNGDYYKIHGNIGIDKDNNLHATGVTVTWVSNDPSDPHRVTDNTPPPAVITALASQGNTTWATDPTQPLTVENNGIQTGSCF